MTSDYQLLDFARSFVDAKCPDLAVKLLDRISRHYSSSSKQLNGRLDDALSGLGGVHLRHRGLTSYSPAPSVLRPCSPVNQERAGVDVSCHRRETGLRQLKVLERLAEHRPC